MADKNNKLPENVPGPWYVDNTCTPCRTCMEVSGADGLLIEVHSNPECALCDGEESLKPARFKDLMKDLRRIAEAVDREIE